MPKKESAELEYVTIRLYKGDRDRLMSYYSDIGYNLAIRKIVHKHLKSLDENIARRNLSPSED